MTLVASKQIVVVGAGGHGRVVCEAIIAEGGYGMLGFVDDSLQPGTRVGASLVLGPLADMPQLLAEGRVTHCVVAAGDNAMRRRLVEKIEQLAPSVSWGTVLHPTVQISPSATVGAGSVLLAAAVVTTAAQIGRHCIVNTGSQLDHNGQMADFSSLAPGAKTGGNVQIGQGTAIGLGASIIHGITIGAESVVGAGAVVVRDVPPAVVSLGVPSVVVCSRQPGDPTL